MYASFRKMTADNWQSFFLRKIKHTRAVSTDRVIQFAQYTWPAINCSPRFQFKIEDVEKTSTKIDTRSYINPRSLLHRTLDPALPLMCVRVYRAVNPLFRDDCRCGPRARVNPRGRMMIIIIFEYYNRYCTHYRVWLSSRSRYCSRDGFSNFERWLARVSITCKTMLRNARARRDALLLLLLFLNCNA